MVGVDVRVDLVAKVEAGDVIAATVLGVSFAVPMSWAPRNLVWKNFAPVQLVLVSRASVKFVPWTWAS